MSGLIINFIFKNGRKIGFEAKWHTGRIQAIVKEGEITIKRNLGLTGDDKITLKNDEFLILDKICEHWQDIRDTWSAFYHSSAGYPAGCGGAWYYQPNGKGSKEIQKIGESQGGVYSGKEFQGFEIKRETEKPIKISSKFYKSADIIRVNEVVGEAEEMVGQRYIINDDVSVEARRNDLIIWSRDRWTTIERGDEEEFIHEIVLCIGNMSITL